MAKRILDHLVRSVPAWRLSDVVKDPSAVPPSRERVAEEVVREETVALTVNGTTLLRFTCLPDRLADLGVGFLACEGLIANVGQLRSVDVKPGDISVNADIAVGELMNFHDSVTMVSGCGRGGSRRSAVGSALIESHVRFSPEACLAAMDQLERASGLFKATGGVHLAALSSGEGLLDVAEDVGRHNAVDKVVGRALRGAGESSDLANLMLLTTGRLSSEIAAKAARVGLPVVVSRSAPTSAAVELAREVDLCLVGFARGRRLNVYSAPWRLGIAEEKH